MAGRDATVSQLVDAFDLAQPTISKNLKVLERAGLVSRGREAQFRPVRLDARGLAGVDAWLGDYRRFWDQSFERLDAYLKDLKKMDDKGE
jgi:DNA-binding transcriptional ArsR family regulator